MIEIIQKTSSITRKSLASIRSDGFKGFVKRGAKFIYYRQFPDKKKKVYKDILFINGCTLPHPTRYRVDHQIEQLRAGGLSADAVFYDQLTVDMTKYYRGFIFFRCPATDTVREVIAHAKSFNKVCFFDIDDLVIDQKYTDQIEYVRNLPDVEKKHYDDGVNRMRETLQLCDYGITTTYRLQIELSHYIKEVFVNRNVASDEMARRSIDALDNVEKDTSKVVIGYFSGSITHNEDFALLLPSLVRLFKMHDHIRLKIVGILDLPSELEPFRDRIDAVPFMEWRQMPQELATCDINLAPLVASVFNEAKSENKWVEAALTGVVTVASDIGAFRSAIRSGETGFLVGNDDWFTVLDDLIRDKVKRETVAQRAHDEVLVGNTTVHTSHGLAAFVRSKLAPNIAFVFPSTDISGGVNVALKHADILRARGWDVTIIDAIHKHTLKASQKEYDYRAELPGYQVVADCKTEFEAYFDTMVATLWSTVKYIKEYPNVAHRLYLVQNFETDFYVWGQAEPKILANATYFDQTGIEYITISLWCQDWLDKKFGKKAKYVSNGIDLAFFPQRERDFKGKINILIEGDSKSEYKNTDEAFRIVEKLDPRKYHVSYLSYRKEPKPWYRVDRFYNRIPLEEVGKVYASCDILIKTSLVESFSYPPLEMMATGGVSVVVPNGGNVEYLKDGENCLFYAQGDIASGAAAVERLVGDRVLRNKLIKNGLATAQRYSWSHLEAQIAALYER